ncbi:DUF465 domain-containing protein [Desulfonatronovibrio magnus]|uniref:DUF465 domain-containing protein n=1 Tax=Desulfonatronovibrio magnus TaxID=698827 RepID=UPI0005EAD275|nr:DUF465 domain-containing protein [Desulfonatronovibrio magnus]RQD66768.1 MAG: DUF465 domain-containing protein [Desulfonatronovibrio sp. MSAO_Bac4]
MEQYELELIAKYGEKDEELQSLWDNHIAYEKILEKYESKPYLTPSEDQEVKELKKKKLAGKTKIHAILDKYKKMEG